MLTRDAEQFRRGGGGQHVITHVHHGSVKHQKHNEVAVGRAGSERAHFVLEGRSGVGRVPQNSSPSPSSRASCFSCSSNSAAGSANVPWPYWPNTSKLTQPNSAAHTSATWRISSGGALSCNCSATAANSRPSGAATPCCGRLSALSHHACSAIPARVTTTRVPGPVVRSPGAS